MVRGMPRAILLAVVVLSIGLVAAIPAGCMRPKPDVPQADGGASPPQAPDPAPPGEPPPAAALDPFSVLVSQAPGGQFSMQVVLDPQLGDGGFVVYGRATGQDADLGLQASVDLWTAKAEHLVSWVDEETVLWDGLFAVNLRTGDRRDLFPPGGNTLIDSCYSPSAGAVAHLTVSAGTLRVWVVDLDTGDANTVFTEQLNTVIGDMYGTIEWDGSGQVYFPVPRGHSWNIVRVSVTDSSSATVVADGAHPSVSPDGRYLTYGTSSGGDPSTSVLDLETSAVVGERLPPGVPCWSADSALLAIQGPHEVSVFEVAGCKPVDSFACKGCPVLSHFVGADLVYTDLSLEGSLAEVTIQTVPLDQGS